MPRNFGKLALGGNPLSFARERLIQPGPPFVLFPDMCIRKSAMRAQRVCCPVHCTGMTQLTLQLAATHDHWFEEPVAKHAFPALKLWCKHFSKRRPIVADGLEWAGCSAIAVALLFGTLIANAWPVNWIDRSLRK